MRRRILQILLLFLLPLGSQAQYGFDEMVELTGVVMSSDSLRYLPSVSLQVQGEAQGTRSSNQGVFSIIVEKGKTIEFSCMGFKKQEFTVPDTLTALRYSVIQLMVQDTFYLPTTIVRASLSSEEFETAFLNWNIPPDKYELARRNMEYQSIRAMASIMAKDGDEHADQYQRQQAQKNYWAGGQPPMTIFNPFAWQEFFKSWKRGDFKRKP